MNEINIQEKLRDFKKNFKGVWSPKIDQIIERYVFVTNNKTVHTFDSLVILLISNINSWTYNKLVEYLTYTEQIRAKMIEVIDSRLVLTINKFNIGIKGISQSTVSNFSLVRTKGFDIFDKENYDIVSVEFLENMHTLLKSELDASNYINLFDQFILGNGECITTMEGLVQINRHHVKN